MSRYRLTYALAFACFAIATAVHGQESGRVRGGVAASRRSPDLSEVVDRIIRRTNEFRKEERRPEVKVDAKLTSTARYFADYMASTDEYGHSADGIRAGDRAKRHGYEYCVIAENIAYEYSSAGFSTADLAKKFFAGWKDSPEHRKNMLDPDVTGTGVAIARSEKSGYYYAVQMFGRPEADRIKFKITNQSGVPVRYQVEGRSYLLAPSNTRSHEICRHSDLTLLPPNDKTENQNAGIQKVSPKNGDQYNVITEMTGAVRFIKDRQSFTD
jgi:uncharacterized protein YkwD